jgi:hypothetical protein
MPKNLPAYRRLSPSRAAPCSRLHAPRHPRCQEATRWVYTHILDRASQEEKSAAALTGPGQLGGTTPYGDREGKVRQPPRRPRDYDRRHYPKGQSSSRSRCSPCKPARILPPGVAGVVAAGLYRASSRLARACRRARRRDGSGRRFVSWRRDTGCPGRRGTINTEPVERATN